MSNSDIIKAQNTPVPLDKCGMALAAQQLMEKWSMLIIREAFYGVGRFEDFQEDLGIPRSVLTDRLKRLVELDILLRIPYRPQGTRTRFGYILTERGQELALTILALMQWGDRWNAPDGAPLLLTHKGCGGSLALELRCDSCGAQPGARDVAYKPGPGSSGA